ncbi:MAG TPA: TonB family protein, partial [Terriglobia bacterium]|nr:TonB family protein [Terriglobia bacterium]
EGNVDPKVFAPPSNKWNQLFPCKNQRRAIALSTPMPPPGKAGTDIVDVVVHAWIWEDGSVKLPQIESSPRADLNEEAMQTVLTWKFLPLMCNDRVATTTGDLVVHFQGR